jgi:hypothetical protein
LNFRSPAHDELVGVLQAAISEFLLLCTDLAGDQLFRRQRAEVVNEPARGVDHFQIDAHRVRQMLGLRWHDHGLTRVHEDAFAQAIGQEHTHRPLEHRDLRVTLRLVFHDQRRPGNGGSYRGRMDLGAASALGHLQEHRPPAQRHIPRAVHE